MSDIAWATDVDLGLAAKHAGEKIVEMYDKAGIGAAGPAGGPDYRSSIVGSVILDAEEFATLDPAKILDEYERMRAVERALVVESPARADVDKAKTILAANWSGEAADRFHEQLYFIEGFLVQHAERVGAAKLAMAIALQVAVDVRANFESLARNTVVACEQEIAQQEQRDAEAGIKWTATLVKSAISMFTTNPADLIRGGLESIVDIGATAEELSLKTSGAPQVVDAYLRARDRLRDDFGSSMAMLREWLDGECAALSHDAAPLLRPMPASYAPTSPDFRYESFEHAARPSETFGPGVDRGRRVPDGDPDSTVSRRLDAQ